MPAVAAQRESSCGPAELDAGVRTHFPHRDRAPFPDPDRLRVIACIDTPEAFDTILISPPRELNRLHHARTPHPFDSRLGPPRIRSLFPDPARRGGPGRHAPRSPLPGPLAMHNARIYCRQSVPRRQRGSGLPARTITTVILCRRRRSPGCLSCPLSSPFERGNVEDGLATRRTWEGKRQCLCLTTWGIRGLAQARRSGGIRPLAVRSGRLILNCRCISAKVSTGPVAWLANKLRTRR